MSTETTLVSADPPSVGSEKLVARRFSPQPPTEVVVPETTNVKLDTPLDTTRPDTSTNTAQASTFSAGNSESIPWIRG